MTRDPRTDPRPGDKLHHPQFASGAVCLITAVGKPQPKHLAARLRDGYVAVRWSADNGHFIEPRGRCYSVRYWPEFMAAATIVHVQQTPEENQCTDSCNA
jgi:hypothetical protein